VLHVTVSTEVAGHQTTQARAALRLDDVEVLLTVASLGTRDATSGDRWVRPTDAPGPDDARQLPPAPPGTASVLDHYEIRIATGRMGDELDGTPGPGRSVLWCRLPEGRRPVSAGDVAFVGDLLMLALSDALGTPTTANSLDNTIRIVDRAPTEWVMLDVRIDATARGYAHAGAHLWTEDGVLLGMATQTLVIRSAGRHGQSTRTTRRIVGDT
jgi:acyl-CoA thioesterase